MRTVEAVVGNWNKVFKHYGLPPITGKRHFKGNCPICGSKGKLRIDDASGKGTYICTCSSGTGWDLLTKTQGKDFKTLAKEVDQIIGNKYESSYPVTKPHSKTENLRIRVLNRFNRLSQLKGTVAAEYLSSRGIENTNIDWLRYCESDHTPEGDFAAIYSIATDSKGNACYLHRTFIVGKHKANITTNKKMNSLQDDHYLEHAQSIAIRLTKLSSTLGIAEGIETALSCSELYDCATWATLSASLMKKFIAPLGVKHLIIFADTDSSLTGHAAAFECGRKNLLSNNDVEKVSIRWPQRGDFNDVINNKIEVYQWVGMR